MEEKNKEIHRVEIARLQNLNFDFGCFSIGTKIKTIDLQGKEIFSFDSNST